MSTEKSAARRFHDDMVLREQRRIDSILARIVGARDLSSAGTREVVQNALETDDSSLHLACQRWWTSASLTAMFSALQLASVHEARPGEFAVIVEITTQLLIDLLGSQREEVAARRETGLAWLRGLVSYETLVAQTDAAFDAISDVVGLPTAPSEVFLCAMLRANVTDWGAATLARSQGLSSAMRHALREVFEDPTRIAIDIEIARQRFLDRMARLDALRRELGGFDPLAVNCFECVLLHSHQTTPQLRMVALGDYAYVDDPAERELLEANLEHNLGAVDAHLRPRGWTVDVASRRDTRWSDRAGGFSTCFDLRPIPYAPAPARWFPVKPEK